MRRFVQGNLSDMDVITAWLASQSGDESFETLVEKRRHQVTEEIEQLSKSVIKLEIDDADFYRQASIYLLSKEDGTTMQEASEKIEKLEQERDARPEGDYAKIAKALEVPKYGSPKDVEKLDKPQREEDGTVEWIRSGTVKLELLKKKFQGR